MDATTKTAASLILDTTSPQHAPSEQVNEKKQMEADDDIETDVDIRPPWYDEKHSDSCSYFHFEYGVHPCGGETCHEQGHHISLADVVQAESDKPDMDPKTRVVQLWQQSKGA